MNTSNLIRFCVALAALTLFANSAFAIDGISASSGNVQIVLPPVNVERQAYESSTSIRVFKEREFSIGTVPINAIAPGVYNAYSDFVDVDIFPTSPIRSYFIHFDPVGTSPTVRLSGSVTFDMPILGVMGRSLTMDNTDGTFGVPGTTYPEVRFDRELEYQNRGNYDFFRLEPDGKTIFFQLECSTDVDQIRVITAVPEPSTFLMVTAGTGLIFFQMKRRRSR